jgi:DNA-binding Lrp family transcriptional regulator
MISDDDASLVDALQIAPRASWATLSEHLGISSVTAAKRWQRLAEEGLAWVTVAPGMATRRPQCFAYVEVTCQPSMRLAVADTVALHPMAVTVEVVTGSADLLVTVCAADLPTLSHYVLEHLSAVEGLVSTQVRIATRLYHEGSAWRLRVLPQATAAAIQGLRSDSPAEGELPDPVGSMPDQAKAIMTQLAIDGRTSYAELAERAGTSPTTARRCVSDLLRSGILILRTDVSAPDAGWPVETYLWANAPINSLRDTAQQLSQMRQARLTATVAAGPVIALSTWLGTVEELHRLELTFAEQLPLLQVVDRLVVLRVVKRMGRLINEGGRSTGVIPINIWDDPLCESGEGEATVRLLRPSGARPARIWLVLNTNSNSWAENAAPMEPLTCGNCPRSPRSTRSSRAPARSSRPIREWAAHSRIRIIRNVPVASRRFRPAC